MKYAAFFLLLFFVTPAHAESVFVWEDSESGMTVTFPDTWERRHNQKPDDKLTIKAPAPESEQPQCRVRVREDAKHLVYPHDAEYGQAVQNAFYSDAFWARYLTEYESPHIFIAKDNGNLGRGHAGFVVASYDLEQAGFVQRRRGLMFAGKYFDKLHIVECSALADEYAKWAPEFQKIIASVDFKKVYSEFPQGNYRNFMLDAMTAHQEPYSNKTKLY